LGSGGSNIRSSWSNRRNNIYYLPGSSGETVRLCHEDSYGRPNYRSVHRLDEVIEATDEEVMDFYSAIQSLFKIIEEIQYHRLKGLIDEDIWVGWDNWFGNMKSYEVVAYFYELKKQNMSPFFREYWENLEERPDNSLVSIVRSLNSEFSK
jgi:hypothetical protein